VSPSKGAKGGKAVGGGAKSSMAPIPKADAESKDFLESVVPAHPAVKLRPMFGNLSAFVNGNMFMGVFGTEVFVRLPDDERDAVAGEGGTPFEPMPGRPMREYVVLPAEWRDDPRRVREWAARSLEWAEQLPAKKPKR
jgi:TfoX/Sxy family transcriptional regulator of competence genes